jgi:hypothetical protein
VDVLESVQSAVVTPDGTCSGGTDATPLKVNIKVCVNTTNYVCATPGACHLVDLDVQFLAP